MKDVLSNQQMRFHFVGWPHWFVALSPMLLAVCNFHRELGGTAKLVLDVMQYDPPNVKVCRVGESQIQRECV